jgi:opacity protein-like surface antigen
MIRIDLRGHHMRRNQSRILLTALLMFLASAAAPPEAQAQGFISPFIGFDFGGDSGCRDASGCEDKNSNLGVAFGTMGNVVGFELEFGYARDFFGEVPGGSSNVLTLMSNLMIAPKIQFFRPYVLGGVGLIKSHTELTTADLLEFTNNSFGWDFGGGVMFFFGDHVGVRGELRRFATFEELPVLGFSVGTDEHLSFSRAAAALVLAF